MKNIKMKEVAKKLQQNYRNKLNEYFNFTLIRLDHNEAYRNDKAVRSMLLSGLEKCLSVGNKKPLISRDNFFNLIAPFGYPEYIENNIFRLMRSRVPTLDYIFKDLVFLKKEFVDVKFTNAELLVRTRNIVIENIDFGQFDIIFDLDAGIPFSNDLVVCAKAINPNYPCRDTSLTHPHILHDSICLGNGHAATAKSLVDFRLFDYFSIVNTILNTYGDEPHLSIEEWDTDPCNDCGDRLSADNGDSPECYHCSKIYCYNCLIDCTACVEKFCGFCMQNSCVICNENTCKSCESICNVCAKICCSDCADESCCGPVCGEDRCSKECDSCSEIICSNCIKKCQECNGIFCSGCYADCPNCDDEK